MCERQCKPTRIAFYLVGMFEGFPLDEVTRDDSLQTVFRSIAYASANDGIRTSNEKHLVVVRSPFHPKYWYGFALQKLLAKEGNDPHLVAFLVMARSGLRST